MGLMDNLKQGASSLADSVNKGVANMQTGGAAGPQGAPQAPPVNPDALLRDLGALTWHDANGTLDEAGAAERQRVMQSLAEFAAAGQLDLSLRTGASAAPPPGAVPPPPPGGAASPPPPPGAAAPPPPGAAAPPPPGAAAPPPPAAEAPMPSAPAGAVPPPPPPSSPDALKAPPEH